MFRGDWIGSSGILGKCVPSNDSSQPLETSIENTDGVAGRDRRQRPATWNRVASRHRRKRLNSLHALKTIRVTRQRERRGWKNAGCPVNSQLIGPGQSSPEMPCHSSSRKPHGATRRRQIRIISASLRCAASSNCRISSFSMAWTSSCARFSSSWLSSLSLTIFFSVSLPSRRTLRRAVL